MKLLSQSAAIGQRLSIGYNTRISKSGLRSVPKTYMLLAIAAFITSIVVLSASASEVDRQGSELAEPVTVAFIGDQGSGEGARSVLQLIKAEGADLVLHQGDFDYQDDPESWDGLITSILGADFPYFASVGNHDTDRFFGTDGYQAKLNSRLSKITGAHCIGDLGVQSACTYKGLFFILSGVGTVPNRPDERNHVAFIRDQLAQDSSIWRICSWHKTQRALQLGRKRDAVGWNAVSRSARARARSCEAASSASWPASPRSWPSWRTWSSPRP